MALKLYNDLNPTSETNLKWSSKSLNDILGSNCLDNSKLIIKKKELLPNIFRTENKSDLENVIYISNLSQENILNNTIESIINIQKNGCSLETNFSKYFLHQAINVARHLKAIYVNISSKQKKRKKEQTKKDSVVSPIITIAVKTGLAFFFTLLKRSSKISGAEDILTDMLEAMNNILLSFDALSLYLIPPPLIGNESLDKVASFIRSCINDNTNNENRTLSINLLCNLALQRGTVSSILDFILFLLTQKNISSVKLEGLKPLILFLINKRKEKIEAYNTMIEEEKRLKQELLNQENNTNSSNNNNDNENDNTNNEDIIENIDETNNDNKSKNISETIEIKNESNDNKNNINNDNQLNNKNDNDNQNIDNNSEINDNNQNDKKLEDIKDNNLDIIEYKDIYYNPELESILLDILDENNNKDEISFDTLITLLLGCLRDLSISTLQIQKDVKTKIISDDESNIVYGMGDTSYTQIDISATGPALQPSFSEKNIKQVEAGAGCVFILDQEGNIYSRGKGDYGRLGTGNTNTTATFSKILFSIVIVKFAVSKDSYGHGLAIDEDGGLWSWGDGDYGKLGHGNTEQCSTPKLISTFSGKEIIDVSCGNTFSVAVTSDGKVYTWGGQSLGQGGATDISTPREINILSNVNSVFCGRCHCFAIADNGNEVYGWGSNGDSQVSGSEGYYDTPIRIEALCGIGINQLAASETHSMALSKSGEVYVWGNKVGCGTDTTQNQPFLIEDITNIIFIEASEEVSFAIDNLNNVYYWGRQSVNVSNSPKLIDELEDATIYQISASADNILFYSIPYSSSPQNSRISPIQKSPFSIELTENSFTLIKELIDQFYDLNNNENSTYYQLEASLYLLRANLYHLHATATLIPSLDLTDIRKYLFEILNSKDLPLNIINVCKDIVKESWEILFPSLEMQEEILMKLLPSSKDEMKTFNETECFLLKVIISSLISNNDLANNFNISKDSEIQVNEDSKFWKLISKLIKFIDFCIIESLNNNNTLNIIIPCLENLLNYFHIRILSNFIENNIKYLTIAPLFIKCILESSQYIFEYCEKSLLESSQIIYDTISKTHVNSLLLYTIIALHFSINDNLKELLPSINNLLTIIDKLNSTIFKDICNEMINNEFIDTINTNNNDKDDIKLNESSWLLTIECSIGTLLGEIYSRYIYLSENNDDDDDNNNNTNTNDVKYTELFKNGISQDIQCDKFLIDFANISDNTNNLYSIIESYAKDSLLLQTDEQYPPLKELVCVILSTFIKLNGLISQAQRLNENQGILSKQFKSIINSTYLIREQIYNDMSNLNPQLSFSSNLSPDNIFIEECKKLTELCNPIIERAKFILNYVIELNQLELFNNDTNIKKNNNDLSRIDLRASLPIVSISNDSFDKLETIRPVDDQNLPLLKITPTIKKFKSLSNKQESNVIISDIRKFLKDSNDIKDLKEQSKKHNIQALERITKLELISKYISEYKWIEAVKHCFIKSSFQIIFINSSPCYDCCNDIYLASKDNRNTIINKTIDLYLCLIKDIKQLSNEILSSNSPILKQQILLTSMIRCITSTFIKSNLSIYINSDIFSILLKIITSDIKLHKSLLLASNRLFNCIVCSTGLSFDDTIICDVLTRYRMMISSKIKNNECVDIYLDQLYRSCISNNMKQYLTDPLWINLLFNIIENETYNISDKIFAIRILEAILPSLSFIDINFQRFRSISYNLFSILSKLLTTKDFQTDSIEIDTILSSCKISDVDPMLISKLLIEEKKEEKEDEKDIPKLSNCVLNPDISKKGSHFFSFNIDNTSTDAISFSIGLVFPSSEKDISAFNEDFLLGNCVLGDCIDIFITTGDELFIHITKNSDPIVDSSTEFSLLEPCKIEIKFTEDFSIHLNEYRYSYEKFALNGHSIPSFSTLSQEIIELLYVLHANNNWNDFINPYLRKSLEETKAFASLNFIGGLYKGVRTGSFVDYSISTGTVQNINDSTRRVKIFNSKDCTIHVETDIYNLKSISRRSLDILQLPIDDKFIKNISNFIKPISESSSFEDIEYSISSGKALSQILSTSKGTQPLVDGTLQDILILLLDLASQHSPLKLKWPLGQLERMILNLQSTLRVQDPKNMACVLDTENLWITDDEDDEDNNEEHSEEDDDENIDDNIKDIEEDNDNSNNEQLFEDSNDNFDTQKEIFDYIGEHIHIEPYEFSSDSEDIDSQDDFSFELAYSESESEENEDFNDIQFEEPTRLKLKDAFKLFFIKHENENDLSDIEITQGINNLLESINENPFPSAIRTSTKTKEEETTPDYIRSFGESFLHLSIDAKRTALYYLQKHLQIYLARKCILKLLLNTNEWKISDNNIITKCFIILRKYSKFLDLPQSDIKKIFNTLLSLDPNAEKYIQSLISNSFKQTLAKQSCLSSKYYSFTTLIPWLKQSILIFPDNKWICSLINSLCASILCPNFSDNDKSNACILLSNICYKMDSNNLKTLFEEQFSSIFITNIPDILKKQRKYQLLVGQNQDQSLFMQSLVSIAFSLKLQTEEQWLNKYFIIRESIDSFNTLSPVPKDLSNIATKKIYKEVTNYEDNKRWTPSMDKALIKWQNNSPSDWKEEVIVYAWGQSSEGQLGSLSGVDQPKISKEFGKLAYEIYGGERCSFLRTEEGDIYATGHGEYGRLGVNDTNGKRELTQVEFNGATIEVLHSSNGSYGSTLAIDSDENVWSWGDGDYGKLGHGDRAQKDIPTQIVTLRDKHIKFIYAGYTHSAAITKDGVLYTWGNGDEGRLGHGNSIYYEIPTIVEGLNGQIVTNVSCGSDHTIALVNNGNFVFTWGNNEYGQLGNGTTNAVNIPTQIEFTQAHQPFIKSDAGCAHSILLTKDGKLFSFGRGDIGTLGITDISNQLSPVLIQTIENQFIIDISVGYNNVTALTKDGRIYVWGANENGELGLGHTRSIYIPELLPISGKKIKFTSIAAGSQHAFAYAKLTDLSQLIPSSLPVEYNILSPVFSEEMLYRGKILHKFSDMFFSTCRLFNLDPTVANTLGVEKIVWRLKEDDKHKMLRRYISQTMNKSDDHGPKIHINRWLSGERSTIFVQVCRQLKDIAPQILMTNRAWKVEFIGEGSIDAGGPYNESITQLCTELQSGKVPIIQPTNNAIKQTGHYQDCVFPVASSKNSTLFKFLGRLFGIGVRGHIPLSLSFPNCFWKLLLDESLKIEDIIEIDEEFVKRHRWLLDLDKNNDEESFNEISNTFPPLISNNKEISLVFSNIKLYVKTAFNLKLHSWNYAITHIQQGFREFIPFSLLRLFSPSELGTLVCGHTEVDWDLLKSCTKYSGYESDSQTIKWLWEVLNNLSAEDGELFLRFVWGKSRLPHSVADFSHTFEVSSAGGGDLALPTGTTCFFKLSLPPYSTKEIMETKLLYAIRNCISIDMDNNADPVILIEDDINDGWL